MREFFLSLKPAIIALALMTVLLGVIYPLFMCGVGHLLFHREASGSLFYYQDGTVLGSEWIAQGFTKPGYFHPRPSNAGAGYDATSSSGSNLGPTAQGLSDALTQRASAYRSENSLSSTTLVPADAITGSGSGLDPHIGVANALLQAQRVASARGLSLFAVQGLIKEYTEGPTLWLFGESRINVLRINLALDKLSNPERSS